MADGLSDADVMQPPASNFDAANNDLNLTPQEQALYKRHLTNLTGPGGVDNPDGSRSTLFQMSVGLGDKFYNIPTVWDGKILEPEAAIARARKEGIDKFPSYGSEEEAEARYQKMHDYMEKDTKQFLDQRAQGLSDDEVMLSPGKREGGLLQAIPELFHTVPKAAELLSTPQGRAALVGGMQKFGEGLLDLFKLPGKAASEGITSEQETEFGVNVALAGIPGTKAIFPIAKTFEQGVMRPAIDRLTPQMPEAVTPPRQFLTDSRGQAYDLPPRGVSRSELAVTGEPHVDAILNSEITKGVIDQPLIDRSHSVPYTAGGSVPLDDPTVFIDWRFPHLMEVDGKVFDPADPFVIHENVEQHTMDLLTKGGMSTEAAYRVAHFEFAEKAEGAWYEAHGISKENAEKAYAPIMAEIQRAPSGPLLQAEVKIDGRYFTGNTHHEAYLDALKELGKKPDEVNVESTDGFVTRTGEHITREQAYELTPNVATRDTAGSGQPSIPSNLYKRPYPHDEPSAARSEAIAEPRPSQAEIAQAKDIIAKAQERGELNPGLGAQPADPLAGLRQAREFGIIGPDKAPIAADSPARAAQRAIPAARQDDKITMTPAGEPVDAWQARFKQWVSRIKEPEDVKPFIERAAQENNNFPEARAGEISPAHVEVVAKAAGVNPSKIDIAELSNKFNNPDKVRMIKQALDQTLQDYKAAKSIVEDDPSIENTGKMLEAEMRRDYMVEYAIGLRAEWGRTGHALRDLLDAAKGAAEEGKPTREQIINDLLAGKERTPSDMADFARATRNLSDEDLARTLTNMRGKGPHWLHWGVSQALISGLITHTFYTVTNFTFMELERVIAPSVSAIFDRLRGNPDPILWGEIGAAQRAIVSSIPQAWQASKQAFWTGLRVPLPDELRLLGEEARGPKSAAKAMAPYVSGQPVNWGIFRRIASDETLAKVEYHLGLPGRSANFQHTFFKNLSFHASADAQAYHAAAKEVADTRSQAFADRMDFWRANPTDAMSRSRIDDGYSGTFMEKLGEKTAAFSRMVRDTPLQWVFFFTHIPMNIARAGVRYTAPYLGKEMRADMLGENGMSKQNLAYAKWTLGASFASYAVYKGLMGDATGSYPTDPKERQRWKDQNIQQNSIKAFDQWWSLERLGPVGIAFKIGADIGYIARSWDHNDKALGENVTNAMGHLALAFANAYSTEAGFQGVANLMDLMQGKRTPSQWAAYQGASFAQPISFLSQAASFMDPHAREAKTLIDGVKMRLPFLRETLPAKLDPLYGEPRPNPGYLNIERHVPVMADPVKQELERLDYHPTAPAPHISGVRLTPEQYDRYQATAGPLVKEALTALVQQPGWSDIPAELRKEALQKTVRTMRAYAAMSMQMDQPEIIESARQARLKRIGLGN